MTERLLAWLDDASDRLSPIVVKEIRQIVRGREFNYSLGLSLVVALAVAFFGATSAATGSGRSGAGVFTTLTSCLAFLGLAVVPLGAFSAMRNERLEQTLDLISLTALSSRGIVVGKLLAQGVKLVTLFAVMAPFIAMSFFLGGVDLLTILIALFVVFLTSLWVSAAALCLSSVFKSRAMSGVLFGGLGLVLFVIFWIGRFVLFAAPLVLVGAGYPPASRTTSQVWWALGTLTVFCLATMTNLVLLAENRLSLATASTVVPLRVGFLVQFLLIVARALASIGEPPYVQASALNFLALAGGAHLAVVAMFTATEDPIAASRARLRKTSRSRWSWLLSFFSAGSDRGAAYVLVQMAVLLVAGWLLGARSADERLLAAICGYICLFTGLPALALLWLRPFGARTGHARAVMLVLIPVSLMLPDVAYFVLWRPESLSLQYSARHLLSPLHNLFNWDEVEARGWQMVPLLFGMVGLFAYGALIYVSRRMNEGRRSVVSLLGADAEGEGGRDGARY